MVDHEVEQLRRAIADLEAADATATEVTVSVRDLRTVLDQRDEARDWVRRLTRTERVLTCAFCGAAYPPGTPASNSLQLTAHVLVCERHPMRAVERALADLRAAVQDEWAAAATCNTALDRQEYAREEVWSLSPEARAERLDAARASVDHARRVLSEACGAVDALVGVPRG